ncbi:MAG TPA: S8 family serine peptidase [Thermoanaerobaculia bacterium]|nr:S8 family serine peptidase [Thermoanaerobaculia bacterium]
MRLRKLLVHASLLAIAVPALAASPLSPDALARKVDPWVLQTASRGDTEFLVMLREQADLRGARRIAGKTEKGAFVADALRSHAESTQGALVNFLASRHAEYRPYWVVNAIWVRGGRELVEALAARDDVFHVYANPRVRLDSPVSREPSGATPSTPETVEWGVARVNAPAVWALGFNGQGIVVAGEDTGYQWDHPALKNHYRGWNGSTADHNYSWHDSIHSGGGTCGADSQFPCDDFGHGTHTMGTMVGDDGGSNQIGVAPGAKWIGCRNMDQGAGTPTTYAECFQWMIAPTDLAGANPDPSKAPHVINNSWGCPVSEGCTDPNILKVVVESVRAAGIEVVVSAGNAGSACGTVEDPPAIYDASFSVGATDIGEAIAGFSSRGPVTVDGSNRMKPDISAPGVNVRSSVPGNAYENLSGTSMAGPHVVGVVALVLSGDPDLIGDTDAIESLLTATAVPRTTAESCGGVPGSQVPNNTFGWGRVDALAAFENADLSIEQTDAPDPTVPGTNVTYTLTITNHGPAGATAVHVVEGLTISASIQSATPSQGSCALVTFGVNCDLGDMAVNAVATVAIVATPSVPATLTSNATVDEGGIDPVSGNNAASVQTTVVACPFPAPTITAPLSVPPATADLQASSDSGAGHADAWTLTGGTITAGDGTNAITFTSGDPGTTMTLSVIDSIDGCAAPETAVSISVDFLDVPPANAFHDFVNAVARAGITAGCGGGDYCPDASVTRAQMAVFLLKAEHGAAYAPPACTGVFADVACPGPFTDWVEQLATEGVTAGCGGGDYCPDASVTRAQMAVFLLKTEHGSAYTPPACAGVFADVACPGPFTDWIERLSAEGVTAGCGGGNYCPDAPNTRGQMAVFLTKTFALP